MTKLSGFELAVLEARVRCAIRKLRSHRSSLTATECCKLACLEENLAGVRYQITLLCAIAGRPGGATVETNL